MSLLKNYPTHIPIKGIDRLIMGAACFFGATLHPENNNYITGIGEITAFEPVLTRIRDSMLSNKVGRQILRERPRITSKTLDLDYLKSLPPDTFGNTYYKWLQREKVSPDTRVPVHYIDDEELAYVFQRYRECHDFHHAISGLPIVLEGEIAVKAFEFANFGLPFAGAGAVISPFKLTQKQRTRLFDVYYPWCFSNGLNCKGLINIYWEQQMEKKIDELRRELGIESPPPDMRTLRKMDGAKKIT
ncbi:ubiquinone biosynthesis protein [Saccharomycopsis crataegensis]|uniref:4-hydroxy-3-methoxy-5-polyprenylbenzoate decarboxylase n=1 Tax=Saccharomycopsis crataegensis TaxID=43959 RepID=A0AAV5QFC3_9ASCO|nr:ubiquinone biosynthesis protein [Saccharomycopsis crataegensis]